MLVSQPFRVSYPLVSVNGNVVSKVAGKGHNLSLLDVKGKGASQTRRGLK